MNFAALLLFPAVFQVPETFLLHSLKGTQPVEIRHFDASLLTHLVSLRHARLPLPSWLDEHCLVLSQGDIWPLDAGRPIRLEEERLHFTPGQPFRREEMSVSLVQVSLLWFGKARSPGFLDQLHRQSRSRDVLFLTSGARLEGSLTDLHEMGARLQAEGKLVEYPWHQLQGIAFNTELRIRPRPKGVFYHLVLANGARVSLTQPSLEQNGRVKGKSLAGPRLEFPWAAVRAFDVRSGPAVYLSDLRPAHYESTPYLGLDYPLGLDRTTEGGPLRLEGSTFDKGLGMHAQAAVRYEWNEDFRIFEAVAGLDEDAAPRGRARVEVLVENQVKFAADLSPKKRSVPVRLELGGAKRMTLQVLFGEWGDVQGSVNWIDARLLREK